MTEHELIRQSSIFFLGGGVQDLIIDVLYFFFHLAFGSANLASYIPGMKANICYCFLLC